MEQFESFSTGRLLLSDSQIDLSSVEWTKHPTFEGVELKHIVTAQHTGGAFSYHLVRIAPDKKIGSHTHKTQLETHEIIKGRGICVADCKRMIYEQGIISIIPAGIDHEVLAGENGLYLFAKFIPALC